MKKKYFWLMMPFLMLLSGCLEEAELDALDEPTGVTIADVQNDGVVLSTDLSQLCYYDDMQEQGFIIKRIAPNPANPSERVPFLDTVRVTGDFACKLVEDLSSSYEMEAYAYFHTSKLRIRSTTTHFKPLQGVKPQVKGMHVYPDAQCDATGYVTVYGEHLTKIRYQAMMSIVSETYGGEVEFRPSVCTRDSIRFSYRCLNIGDFDLNVNVLGTSFNLPEKLHVADASLDAIDRVAYAGIPHLMDIRCKSGTVKSISCTVDKNYEMTTLKKDNQWHAVFMGKIGQTHQVQIHYTNNSNYDIYFPPFEVKYQNAWQQVGQKEVMPPQCVVGGYGWSLKGGWNESWYPVRLEKLDFATGEVTTIDAPCKSGVDDVDHLLGYAADYCAFGDLNDSKVYCAAYIGLNGGDPDDYHESHFGKEVIRLFEYDMTADSWTKLYDLPTSGSQESNGYQTWAKVGDRFYFVNYVKGQVGYWDRSTGELWSDSRDYLRDYYNNYCGYDGQYFYWLTNDMYALSMSDLSREIILPDFYFASFKTSEINGQSYGKSHVIDGIIYNGRMMCSAPVADYENRTYYGSPDGMNGGMLLPVGDKMYMVLSSNDLQGTLWRYQK